MQPAVVDVCIVALHKVYIMGERISVPYSNYYTVCTTRVAITETVGIDLSQSAEQSPETSCSLKSDFCAETQSAGTEFPFEEPVDLLLYPEGRFTFSFERLRMRFGGLRRQPTL